MRAVEIRIHEQVVAGRALLHDGVQLSLTRALWDRAESWCKKPAWKVRHNQKKRGAGSPRWRHPDALFLGRSKCPCRTLDSATARQCASWRSLYKKAWGLSKWNRGKWMLSKTFEFRDWSTSFEKKKSTLGALQRTTTTHDVRRHPVLLSWVAVFTKGSPCKSRRPGGCLLASMICRYT